MKYKQIRRIIVLIMCLVLLFNVVTSAYAAGVGTIFFGSMAAAAVVASAYQCLGVLKGMDDTDFVNLVNSGVSHLESTTDLVSEGYIRMLGVRYGDTDQFVSYAQNTMIQALAQYIADNEIVKTAPSVTSQTFSYSGNTYTATSDYPFQLVCIRMTGYSLYDGWGIFAYAPMASEFRSVIVGGESIGAAKHGNYRVASIYTIRTQTAPVTNLRILVDDRGNTSWNTTLNYIFGTTVSSVYSDLPISIGDYESPYIDGAPVGFGSLAVYTPWASQGVSVPLPGTTTEEDWVPVSIGGSTLDDTVLGQTQVGAQAGTAVDGLTWEEVGSESIPDTEVGSATLADILSAVLSIPQAIVGSIAQALSNFFGISGTADAYAISLTDFFPFCIPFDIYDFLSVLSAEPEAPVFHWEIPVPQLGRTFDIDVDLSPWDPVAAVFRTFELLAFIVGLGMVTREKFLRS